VDGWATIWSGARRQTRDAGRGGFKIPTVFVAGGCCMFYTLQMAKCSLKPRRRATLSLRLGPWLEAHATGWGVAAVPLVVVLVLAAAALKWLLQ
jgi:hypothetical protein